jgi:hypothetical protein
MPGASRWLDANVSAAFPKRHADKIVALRRFIPVLYDIIDYLSFVMELVVGIDGINIEKLENK